MTYPAAEKLGEGEVGQERWVGLPEGAVHIAAARLGCKPAMVGTRWAISHPGCVSSVKIITIYHALVCLSIATLTQSKFLTTEILFWVQI